MLGFIGAGNMGGAILRGVLRAGLHAPEDIVFSAGTPEEAGAVAEATGARAVAANVDVVREAGPGSVVVLAVKPHVVPAVLAEIAQAAAEEGTVLVSVAAGTSLEKLGAPLGGLTVRDDSELEGFCAENRVDAAVLCVPKENVGRILDRLYSLGVRNFWNFSHYDIASRYSDVVVENVHLSDSLMTLGYRMNNL